jgi:hypothetical protein
MTSNHLVVGLGGTGGKILRALRKNVYQEFGGQDPAHVNLRYLYVDSSDEMMGAADASWKILGESLQLTESSRLKLSAAGLPAVLDNLESYPAICPWIGSRDALRNMLISARPVVVAGQKRRLGRLLFACQVNEFRRRVQSLVLEMQDGIKAPVTFHVCLSLAGGTGGGSVVDAVSQIRALFPDKSHRILIYGFLPEREPAANRSGENYHANGNAALLELNALSVGVFRPHDVSGEREDRRLELEDPFNACYLFSDQMDDGNKLDVDREVHEFVASFLYQKVLVARNGVWESLRRQESFENMDVRPEESPFSHTPERSRRFFAFGLKQIVYPEMEIREHLTSVLARQAVLQLHFNRWMGPSGYSEEPGPASRGPVQQSFNELVRLKETQQKWYLTDEHLMLSEGILPDETRNKRWKSINAYWTDLIPNFRSHIRESFAGNERFWLDELAKLCEAAYSQNYRGMGVRSFYDIKSGEVTTHARELRGGIERDLFGEWLAGEKSIFDIGRLLSALVSSLEVRRKQLDDKMGRHRQLEEETANRVAANAREWSRVGMLSGLMGKRQNVFDAQGEYLQQLYVYRTRMEGIEFARKLLSALLAELATLAADVAQCAVVMDETAKHFAARIADRQTASNHGDLSRPVIRFYDPAAVTEFARALVSNQGEQQRQGTAVRAALAALVSDDKSFGGFNRLVPPLGFISLLESTLAPVLSAAHDNHVAANPQSARILGVGIVERLCQEYSEQPEALHLYIDSVVSRMGNSLRFDDAEVTREGLGAFAGKRFVSYLSVILPQAPELADFRELLRWEFYNAISGGKDEVTSTSRPHEITLVRVTNLFPVRFVQEVALLRQKYERRVRSSDFVQAKMELHLEGDGSALPSLYVPDVEPKKFLAYLMIGKAMEVVQMLEDPQTGARNLYLVNKNSKVPLGKDVSEALGVSNLLTYDALVATIQPLLKKEYLQFQKRQALSASVEAQVDEIRTRSASPSDKLYRMFYHAGETAVVLLGTRQ